ncbi:hypothetical protein C6496_14280 [Candidatus Poribacteria bacterium]|nr:MAG: hypothetical protein C6496_14280 [Candidatus Poribacteria bacterium]
MHVAFGRVRRKSRVDADDTDDADFKTSFCQTMAYITVASMKKSAETPKQKHPKQKHSLLQQTAVSG